MKDGGAEQGAEPSALPGAERRETRLGEWQLVSISLLFLLLLCPISSDAE